MYYRTPEIFDLLLLLSKFNFSLPHRNQHSITAMRAGSKEVDFEGAAWLSTCPSSDDGGADGSGRLEYGKAYVSSFLIASPVYCLTPTRPSAPQWGEFFSRALSDPKISLLSLARNVRVKILQHLSAKFVRCRPSWWTEGENVKISSSAHPIPRFKESKSLLNYRSKAGRRSSAEAQKGSKKRKSYGFCRITKFFTRITEHH